MADDDVTLVLPRGDAWQYDISHDIVSYVPFRADHTDPDSPWHVTVPRHVAVHYLHNGGFSLANIQIMRSEGNVRLRHPDGIGCSWGGIWFEPDAFGVVVMPVEAVPDLTGHGFVGAPDAIEEELPEKRSHHRKVSDD